MPHRPDPRGRCAFRVTDTNIQKHNPGLADAGVATMVVPPRGLI